MKRRKYQNSPSRIGTVTSVSAVEALTSSTRRAAASRVGAVTVSAHAFSASK